MKSFLTGLAVLLTCAGYVACTSEQAPKPGTSVNCATTVVTSARIYAIVQQNCTNRNCHPGSGAPLNADFSSLAKLKSYISNNGTSWRARVTDLTADMPQFMGYPALSRATRDSIACWVNKGMPD
ncbi:hypothetical protein EGT74_10955 [Chitinophaga lutea]|uniref:Cytochrome c n=1 Tax=Chitinophaga lutea TaxID=2488634 RepID=A0A3N4QDF9_9BACT|nr:hypothetical protein [Chitinophaga lutea]RPE14000.1 hypothetical protein EGT74_10955 [Chitinophaga lutea]